MATFQAYQPINMDTLSVLSGDFTDWSGSMLEYTAGSTVMTYFGAFTITDTGVWVVLDQSDGPVPVAP